MDIYSEKTFSFLNDHQTECTVCAKSLQSCSTLCDPVDCRLFCPWDSPGKNIEIGCHFLLHLPHPGIELHFFVSCTGRQVLYHEYHLGSPQNRVQISNVSGCRCAFDRAKSSLQNIRKAWKVLRIKTSIFFVIS